MKTEHEPKHGSDYEGIPLSGPCFFILSSNTYTLVMLK
ncbi:hypothetical protein B835_2463 [Enterococcus mundtii 3F]|nr:hypothetical protein [Enterococcus mundtii 3F]